MAVRRGQKQSGGDYELIIDGWENGMFSSPHKGIANIQGANISTEPGEVMCSYARQMISPKAIVNGTLSATNTGFMYGYSGTIPLNPGTWINVTSVTNGCIGTGWYYVMDESTSTTIYLRTTYGGISTGGEVAASATGVATFQVPAVNQITAIAQEDLGNGNYNFYFLEKGGADGVQVWMNISAHSATILYGLIAPGTNAFTNATGLSIFPGVIQRYYSSTLKQTQSDTSLFVIGETSTLEGGLVANTDNIHFSSWAGFTVMPTATPTFLPSTNGVSHELLYGHANILYQLDGQNIISIAPAFANTAFIFTSDGSTANLTIGASTQGDGPTIGMPVVLTTSNTLPTGFSTGTTYYVVALPTATTFQLSATPGGSPITASGVGAGVQYLTSVYFQPVAGTLAGSAISAVSASYIVSNPALQLAANETAQCIAELGTNLYIGGKTNNLYSWNQTSLVGLDNTLINSYFYPIWLQEANVQQLVTANNMLFIFAGNKGNVYETSGSAANLVTTIPDYVSGQIEPYFTFTSAMYGRGKIWFGPMQGSGTSNIGGVWQITPMQGQLMGIETGVGQVLSNQNSYGTYLGGCTALLINPIQAAQGIQFFSGWADGNGNYGIDISASTPYTGGSIIETDLIPVGTTYNKKTFSQIEYILATPLATGESIQLYYRTSLSDSWHTLGTPNTETGGLSGVYAVDFQQVLLLQLRAVLTSTASSPSFVRLMQIIIR